MDMASQRAVTAPASDPLTDGPPPRRPADRQLHAPIAAPVRRPPESVATTCATVAAARNIRSVTGRNFFGRKAVEAGHASTAFLLKFPISKTLCISSKKL